jgi:hypothetical protein
MSPSWSLAASRQARTIPEGEFWEQYKPLPRKDGSCIWDTPDDLDVLQAAPRDCVWTITEGDNGEDWYASPGWHVVNRIGYCITEEPWDASIEAAEYDIREGHEDESWRDRDEDDDIEEDDVEPDSPDD